ncbi:hypothetical protein, partial [Nocardia sp. NPDC004604]|uniref:hypothetical protein n=1 Tax=Nocardia sp. NPDC004604 TaxID=3157013 RepID=UPI0033AD9014
SGHSLLSNQTEVEADGGWDDRRVGILRTSIDGRTTMFNSSLRSDLAFVTGVVGCCAGILAATATAQPATSITVEPELGYNVSALTINGSATCDGGGTAGVDVVDGSLEQMMQGDLGGPIAVQLDGPVMVDCDSTAHTWSGNLVAPGRTLPNESGGTVTVTLSQGQTVIASTGPQSVRIAR